jgi:hypothetical protein
VCGKFAGNPLGIAGAAAKKLTNRLRLLLGKQVSDSGHVLSGAHACLVPINVATSNIHPYDKNKSARHTTACNYRHLLLLPPFILSNLFREEVQAHTSRRRGLDPESDPSEDLRLIGDPNVFLNWYPLFRRTTPGKTPADITKLPLP